MRINISNSLSNDLRRGGVIVGPSDPPPPVDINDRLSLDQFSVSDTRPKPFEEFDVTWAISARNNANLADYEFRLKTHYDPMGDSIAPQGTQTFAIHTQTLLSLQAKRIGSGAWRTVGQAIAMQIDDSTCEHREFPGSLFDATIEQQVEAALADVAALRLTGSGIDVDWFTSHIAIKIPLEIVLNNFFNGNLSITLKIYFGVDYDSNQECNLDVTVFSSEDANFHWLEDIASLGHTATIAKTIEKLMPTIMAPIIARTERGILAGLCAYLDLGNYFDDHRLLSVRIVPNGNLNYLDFVFCEKIAEPVQPGGPLAPDGGVVMG